VSAEKPDGLQGEVSQGKWGKILTATPVVMTVIATLLAGLSSSEMTRAQYVRSFAAQQQSKAGDQWAFFQAKRLRGAMQRSTLDLLQTSTEVHSLDPTVLRASLEEILAAGAADEKTKVLAVLGSDAGRQTLDALQTGELPGGDAAPAPDPSVQAVLAAVEDSRPETEIASLLDGVNDRTLDDALPACRKNSTGQ
jgi:hypothetical protein